MAKNEKKPENQESIDDIQQQITELMGPPPLETTPLNPSQSKAATPNASTDLANAEAQTPEPINNFKIKKISEKKADKKPNSDSEAVLDKNMTIEEAENKAQLKSEEDNSLPSYEKTDSIYSSKVTRAVNDIETHEGREKVDNHEQLHQKPIKPSKKRLAFLKKIKINKKTIILFTIVLIFVLFLIPFTRYKILNTFGVRSAVNLTVVDSSTKLPLKNVDVSVNGANAKTNDKGEASLTGVKLGASELVLSKRSFTTISEKIVVGWGSNPIDAPYQMVPAGTKYSFMLVDFLSNEPIAGVKITDGNSTALSNKAGLAEIKIEPNQEQSSVEIQSDIYTAKKITISSNPSNSAIQIKLIPKQPNVFISNRDGKYDLYSRLVDGTNETKILPATGSENIYEMSILPKPNSPTVAFVSTREGSKNKEGYLLSNLYIINSQEKQVSKVSGSTAEKIQILGWAKDRLIYAKITAGPSGGQDGRYRVISFNTDDESQKDLAAANEIIDVRLIGSTVYYAVNSAIAGQSKLYSISTDGSGKKVILDKQIWSVKQNEPNILLVNSADKKWYQLTTNDGKTIEYKSADAQQPGKFYTPNPDNKLYAYIEKRDGKDSLIIKNSDQSKGEEVILVKSGLTNPINWLNNNYLTLNISNNNESATYIVNVSAKKFQKIGDDTKLSQNGIWY